MNSIFLISQEVNNDYFTYNSAVVVAKNNVDAKFIHPSQFAKGYNDELGFYGVYTSGSKVGEKYEYGDDEWCVPEKVMVELIGTTSIDIGTIICSSYNAG